MFCPSFQAPARHCPRCHAPTFVTLSRCVEGTVHFPTQDTIEEKPVIVSKSLVLGTFMGMAPTRIIDCVENSDFDGLLAPWESNPVVSAER